MEKLNKIKEIFLSILTFICILILVVDIVLFSLKKISQKYLNIELLKKGVDNIDVIELFKDKEGELEEFKDIKNKLEEAGIPKESIESFINSKPVDKYTKEKLNKALDNIEKNKKEKLVTSKDLNQFLENNIEDISNELKEKNVPKSEYLTKENQEKFISKIKEKTPYIEQKIDEITNKINEKLGFDYISKLRKIYILLKNIYIVLFDILLILIFIIFIIGIVITRKSIYKSLKWFGITFIISGIILKIMNLMLRKINQLNITNLLKDITKDIIKQLNNYSLVYIIIGTVIIVINLIIYLILLKRENDKFKNIDSN